MKKLLYTRKEAAALLSISVDTLDALRAKGIIRALCIGVRVYIAGDELEDFVRRLEAYRC